MVGDANPALSEYPLGVLLARGIVTQEQHDAGVKDAFLAGRVLGRTKPYRPDAAGASVTGDETLTPKMEERWREAVDRLLLCGRRCKDAVDNVVVFHRFPSWLGRPRPRASDTREFDALIDSLTVLAAWKSGNR